jgi:hypothetical protein
LNAPDEKTSRPRRSSQALLALVIIASASATAAPSREHSSARAEPVGASEVVGKAAPHLLQKQNASLRVYAFRDGAAVPIPFQVDERDRRDHWADDAGPQPVRDETPGVFDENDVVVFMNRDLGAKGDAAKLPDGATDWIEVRVGSKEAPIGYAYVGAFRSPPPLASPPRDHARYDDKRDEVFADRYTVRFGGPLPTHLALVRRAGDDGENVLNGVHAYGEARILGGVFHFERSERDLQYTIQGHRDGPVRAIRSAKYWIRLPLGFKARGRVELLFYGDYVEARARVNIKIPPRLVPADGSMTAYFDFRDFAGARVLDPDGVLAEQIDGRMTDRKRSFNARPVRWAALLLPNGETFLLAVRLGGSLQRLDQQLYLDDSSDPNRGKPSFGFMLAGVNRLDTGEQELSVNAMILATTSASEVTAAAATLLSTPEVAVTAIEVPLTRPH